MKAVITSRQVNTLREVKKVKGLKDFNITDFPLKIVNILTHKCV